MNARTRTVLILTALAIVGACGVCSVGGLALTGLDDGDAPSSSASGFSVAPPTPFRPNGPGRFVHEWMVDDPSIGAPLHYGVELIHLPTLDARDDTEAALAHLWSTAVGNDWVEANGAPVTPPLVLRRFLKSGARAWFATGELKPKGGGDLTLVWLLLVEAADHLEPLVVLQTYRSDAHLAATKDEFARYSWAVSHPLVEQALSGVGGTALELPLVPEEALIGAWKHTNGSALEWVNTTTGAATTTALSYLVRYDFTAGHRYFYSYASADGVVGAQRFAGERAEGTWALAGDVLTLTGDDGKVRRLLVLGAPTRADGTRGLMLYPEPWSLQPRAIKYSAELYTPLAGE
jgi:hypothetical protein